MSRAKVEGLVRVVCADWVSHPMDPERAAEWAERAQCSNEHTTVPASEFTDAQTGSRLVVPDDE